MQENLTFYFNTFFYINILVLTIMYVVWNSTEPNFNEFFNITIRTQKISIEQYKLNFDTKKKLDSKNAKNKREKMRKTKLQLEQFMIVNYLVDISTSAHFIYPKNYAINLKYLES